MAGKDHDVDLILRTRKNGFDGTVPTIPNPAIEAVFRRFLHRPAAIPDALHAAFDADTDEDALAHANSRIF